MNEEVDTLAKMVRMVSGNAELGLPVSYGRLYPALEAIAKKTGLPVDAVSKTASIRGDGTGYIVLSVPLRG